ncbi:unnamed protein product [Urochloa humidicola]
MDPGNGARSPGAWTRNMHAVHATCSTKRVSELPEAAVGQQRSVTADSVMYIMRDVFPHLLELLILYHCSVLSWFCICTEVLLIKTREEDSIESTNELWETMEALHYFHGYAVYHASLGCWHNAVCLI